MTGVQTCALPIYMYKEFAPAGSKQGQATVAKGSKTSVELVAEKPVGVCVPKGKDKELRVETKASPSVDAPVTKGQKLGEIIIYSGQEEQGKINLIAKEEVKKASLLELLQRTIKYSYGMSKLQPQS